MVHAGLDGEDSMSKTTMHNSKASFEVRELKDELSGEQLQKVSGGNPSGPGESSASFHDFNFTHHYDKASPRPLTTATDGERS
jgi:type VI protein secretion system component Hcp